MLDGVQGLIFDFDGVIVDSEIANLTSAERAFGARGVTLDEADRRMVCGRHPRDYAPLIAGRHGIPATSVDEIIHEQGAIYLELAPRVPFVDGSKETLLALHGAGYRIAVASSSERVRVTGILEQRGLLDLMHFVLCREDVERPKPSPEIYVRATQRMELPAEALAVVEDSLPGVSAAKAAGLTCWALRTPHVDPADLAQADRVLESFAPLRPSSDR